MGRKAKIYRVKQHFERAFAIEGKAAMSISEFPISVIERLNYYVYLLIDPQSGQVFYIGKGTGNRVFAHAHAAITNVSPGEKLDKIREIMAKGVETKYVILRHGLTEKEAFEVEAALIDYADIKTLTNQVHGHSSDDRGQMTASDIVAKYAAPEAEIVEPVLLITVNRLYRPDMRADELYEITRGNWVVGTRRDSVKYAFTVYNGIIREMYQVDRWFSVTARRLEQRTQNRWRFEGGIAFDLRHYVGCSTSKYSILGAQNPIRYVNC